MILVCGGTGFLGSAVTKELLRRGEQVAVLGRDSGRIRARFGSAVEARTGDVRQPQTLPATMQGVDVVVNAVQFPNSPIESPRRGWTFEEVDYNGTRNQVDAAKAAGVRRFVYISGVGAAPDAAKHWFRFKWLAEEYLRNSGLEYVIVRPTWVFGPEDKSLNRLLRFGRFLPFIPLFGDGKQAMQPVFIDDVGRVVADAAVRPEAANQLFELGGPQVMTMNEVLNTALRVSGRKRFILHQPAALGRAVGKLVSALPSPPLPPPPLSADAVDFITESATADNTNLERVLAPRLTSLEEGLATYMKL